MASKLEAGWKWERRGDGFAVKKSLGGRKVARAFVCEIDDIKSVEFEFPELSYCIVPASVVVALLERSK